MFPSSCQQAVHSLSAHDPPRIEERRFGRFFCWLLVNDQFLLIKTSLQSNLRPLKTIAQSLKLNVQ